MKNASGNHLTHLSMLQQLLPFTVLKLSFFKELLKKSTILLQQLLPFTVLKRDHYVELRHQRNA